ncbi:MAG TPA: winged helix-turn-helix domain-containing protein [Blastocatellia bacterium]|nr:winged helix-turn-helix domain-containing protein [Blastocatellia bacterium]
MAKQINHFYEFGSVRLDATNRLLYKNGEQLSIQPRVIETLLVLVKNAHAVVDKETLLDAVWPDVIVEEGGLKRNISLLRKALGEEGRFIETLSKRGYRFTAEVKQSWEETPFNGTEQAGGEVLLERRASLRITHEREEEINSLGSVESDALERMAINEPSRIAAISRRALPALLVLAVVTTGLIGYRWATRISGDAQAKAPVRSIAILPFKTLGPVEQEEYLELGLADVLITALSNSREINIRPTSAVLKYSKSERDPVEVGRELKVDAVVEGSVQRVDDRIRVTVRLLNVNQQAPLWAGVFDEQAADILRVQDSISNRVATALRLNLSGTQGEGFAKRYTNNPDAFNLYMKGRFFWNKRTVEGYWKAIKYFEQAVAIDPDYALAYAGIADSYALLQQRDGLPAEEAFSKAEQAASKALTIDATLAEAHASMALVKSLHHMDIRGSEDHLRRAIELNPRYAMARGWYGFQLLKTERFEESEAELMQAQELDPTSLNIAIYLAWHYYYSRQYDRAIEQAGKAIELEPDVHTAYLVLFWSYEQKRLYDQAVDAAVTRMGILKMEGADQLKAAYKQSGIQGFWQTYIKILRRESLSQSDRESWIARCYAHLGKYDLALKELESGYRNRGARTHWAKTEPAFDGLRSDPRFIALLRRMGLES